MSTIDPSSTPQDSEIFIALFWAGCRPENAFTLMQLIHAFDWINRYIPTAEELDGSLNRLIAAGLLARENDNFALPLDIFNEFDAYRKRRRKNKFVLAKAFLAAREPLTEVARSVSITEDAYRSALEMYRNEWTKYYQGTR